MKKIAIVVLVWLVLAPASAFGIGQPKQENKFVVTQSTTDFGLYGEFASFYVGKGNATVMVLTSIGGAVEVPVNFSWPELEGLVGLRIGGGVGNRWWLYYHHDIYPEIPPIIALIMAYNLSESAAIPKAKSLAQKIGANVGVNFYPFWSKEEGGVTFILFTSETSFEENVEFVRNKILPLFPDEGLALFADSPIVDQNLDDGRYTRAWLTLIRDTSDVDEDNDTEEFAPIIGLATVIRDAIQDVGDGWHNLSIRKALQLPENVSIAPKSDSNISILKISHYLPLEIDENRTNPLPDNPMYEYSGKLIYILKAPNVSRNYTDIVVYGKLFNFTEERESMPLVTAGFYISNVSDISDFHGYEALNITYKLTIANWGRGDAKNLIAGFEIKGKVKEILDKMVEHYHGLLGYNDFLYGPGWTYDTIETEGVSTYAFVREIPTLAANSTIELEFNLILVWQAVGFGGVVASVNVLKGPLYLYEDVEGKQYFGFANGFSVIPDKIATVAVLIPHTPELLDEDELLYECNFNLTVLGFGDTPIKNVHARLFLGKPEGVFSISDLVEVAGEHTNQISPTVHNNFSYTFQLRFERRFRSGVWFVFGVVEFDVETEHFGTVHLGIITNSYMVYVPPMPWLIQRWISKHVFPYKHVELDVSKAATYDNTTGELTIRLNITNIGDTNTTIEIAEFLLIDYVDTNAGKNGIVDFVVNGESRIDEIEIHAKKDLGVIVVVSPEIDIDVNETVTIEIRVKIKVNYTGEFIVRPTLIHYIFGRHAPDQIEKGEDQAKECGSRARGELEEEGVVGEGGHGQKLKVMVDKSMQIFQGERGTALSTYTNAVVLTVTPPSGRRVPWGFIILLTLIISIVVVAYVVVSKRKS